MSPAVQTSTPHGRPARRPAVLIVEDEAVVARDLQRTLGDMGYDVVGSVATSADALRAAAERQPDVVLMDIRIHGEPDGIETAALLRRRWHVPVIYLTAYADEETVARAAQSEPYGYLVKPFTSREVRSAIEVARYKHAVDTSTSERERWFSTILRAISDGVVACDPERRVKFMNPVAEQLAGTSEHEAAGLRVEQVFGAEDGALARLVDHALLERRVHHAPAGAARLLGRAGQERTIEAVAAPIVADGVLCGAVLALRDVSEQRRMQERVALGQHLASLGTLAAGLCHEINNPLTFIVANAQVLASAVDAWRVQLRDQGSFDLADRTWKASAALEDLCEGAERIRRIVADLSVFGQPPEGPCTATDVLSSIERALRVSAPQIRPRARVITDLQPVPPVHANEARVSQLVVHLLINAAHALPEAEAERNEIRISTDVGDRGRVLIAVQDSGAGIAAHVLPRIFDPFYTTKLDPAGSGLGLSICHGIVQSLGGEIRVHSRPGEGSRFEVMLPAAEPEPIAPAPVPTPARAASPGKRARILVVDEEPAVLRTIESLLSGRHDVLTARDGYDALRLIEGGAPFDLVLCDVMMSGFGGIDLYERMVAAGSPLAGRFVFVTAGSYTPRAQRFLASAANPRLAKPFDAPALEAVVAYVLGARSVD